MQEFYNQFSYTESFQLYVIEKTQFKFHAIEKEHFPPNFLFTTFVKRKD